MVFDVQTVLFYLFSALLVLAGLMVVSSRNPVHSVLYLIFSFFNAAALFLLLGAEYIAMTLVIVYVGAVAILFLFVVMMLDIKLVATKQKLVQMLPFGTLFAIGMFGFIYLLLERATWQGGVRIKTQPIPNPAEITNTHAIGHILYTDYLYLFQICGLILLVAMIGAIVLTLRHGKNVRRQSSMQQLARRPKDSVELIDVEIGKGV